jgi:nucleoside phosphorylase
MPRIGTIPAASVATSLRSSFPYVRVGLLVWVCGGVPFYRSGQQDIILGDVIISTHIVQIDFGRLYPHIFVRKNMLQDNLGRPSPEIGGFLSKIQVQAAQTEIKDFMRANLATVVKLSDHGFLRYTGTNKDKLFDAKYRHKHANTRICAVWSMQRSRRRRLL